MRFSRMSRYSCRHSHLSDLHERFPVRFAAQTTLPYCKAITVVIAPPAASVAGLSPVTLSAPPRLTSELLRTL